MAMRCLRLCGIGLCLIALHQSTATAEVVAVFTDESIKASVDAAIAAQPAATGVITADDLPVNRPPYPTPTGYQFCNYNCARKVTVQAGAQTKGVLYVDVRYKPLPGVTAPMMTWLYNSLTGTAVYSATNETYPMYLLFHPRDHMFHLASSLAITPDVTELTWCEMILTNCRWQRRNPTTPWTCSPTAQGFTKATPATQYSKKLQTKETMKVSRFDARGIEFYRQVDLSQFGASGFRTVATARHTWSDGTNGLTLRSQLWIGMMVEGSTTQFDTGIIGQFAKSQIIRQYVGDATNVNNKNMTQVGWMNALHFLEEYGGLKDWLPQVYAGRRKK